MAPNTFTIAHPFKAVWFWFPVPEGVTWVDYHIDEGTGVGIVMWRTRGQPNVYTFEIALSGVADNKPDALVAAMRLTC
jgi:hypothetical protein